jgi:hypothetical protein
MMRLVRSGVLSAATVLALVCALPATATAVVTGASVTVVGGGTPLKGATVRAYIATNEGAEVAFGTTDGSGHVTLETGEGTFKILGSPAKGSGFFPTFDEHAETFSEAVPVTVEPGHVVTVPVDANPELSISGRLLDAATNEPLGPKESASIEVRESAVRLLGVVGTAEDGSFSVGGLHPGSDLVRANAIGYPQTDYQLKYSEATAERVSAGTSGLTVLMRAPGAILGRVSNAMNGEPVNNLTVVARDASTGAVAATTTTHISGSYELSVPGGLSYKIEFEGGVGFATQFYNGKGSLACAEPVAVAEFKKTESINASMTAIGSTLGGCSSTEGTGTGKESSTGHTPLPTASGTPSKVSLVAAAALKVLSGKTTVPVTCNGGVPCHLKLVLTSSPLGKAARAARAKKVLVGSATATVPAGATQRVPIKLTHAGLKLLAAHHGRIKARLAVTGTAGTAALAATGTVTLVVTHRRR